MNKFSNELINNFPEYLFYEINQKRFSLNLLENSNVAISPGVGFGKYVESYIMIALVENKQRIRQAMKNIKAAI